MAEVIGAAEHDDNVGVRIHFGNSVDEIQVESVRLGRILRAESGLPCDAGATDSIIARNAQFSVLCQYIQVNIFLYSRPDPFGNTVAHVIDFLSFQFHAIDSFHFE